MIKLRSIKYNKKVGLITAIAWYSGVEYSIRVDATKWVADIENLNVPDIVLGKCRNKFRKMIMLNESIPSQMTIMWY